MKKKVILTIVLVMLMPIIFTTKVNANLQSRPGAAPLYSRTVSDFFIMARNMEQPNESFGLSATIDQANGNETSPSNGIDVHMMKNTEYGTAVMLGASSYGDIPVVAQQINTNSITGNKTGMYMNASDKYTYTASYLNAGTTANVSKMIIASQRYWNKYTVANASTGYKSGDGTYETDKWKNASYNAWVTTTYPVFMRGRLGIFSFLNSHMSAGSSVAHGNASNYSGTRAVVVCAPGI